MSEKITAERLMGLADNVKTLGVRFGYSAVGSAREDELAEAVAVARTDLFAAVEQVRRERDEAVASLATCKQENAELKERMLAISIRGISVGIFQCINCGKTSNWQEGFPHGQECIMRKLESGEAKP